MKEAAIAITVVLPGTELVTQGYCVGSRTWPQFAPGSFQYRKPSRFIHPRSACEGHGRRYRRDNLHERVEVKRINHQEAYRLDGARANMAEEYLSGPRRAEVDTHRHFAGRLS